MTQSWSERVNILSVYPEAATRDDVAMMAAEIQTMWSALNNIERLSDKTQQEYLSREME